MKPVGYISLNLYPPFSVSLFFWPFSSRHLALSQYKPISNPPNFPSYSFPGSTLLPDCINLVFECLWDSFSLTITVSCYYVFHIVDHSFLETYTTPNGLKFKPWLKGLNVVDIFMQCLKLQGTDTPLCQGLARTLCLFCCFSNSLSVGLVHLSLNWVTIAFPPSPRTLCLLG